MKVIVISDIHGNDETLSKVIDFMKSEQIDQMIILGDIFNNFYELNATSNAISTLLWSIASKVVIIKGNCDSTFDQKLLPVNFVNSYEMVLGTKRCYFHHGHLNPPYSSRYHIYCQGHTHIYKMIENEGILYLNPGSISRPRDYTNGSFIVMSENNITIFDINFKVLEEKKISR